MKPAKQMRDTTLCLGLLLWPLFSACGPTKGLTAAQESSALNTLERAAELPGCNVIVDLPQATPVTSPDEKSTVVVRFFVNRSSCAGDFLYQLESGAPDAWIYPNGWSEIGVLRLTEKPAAFKLVYTPAENTQYADDLRIRIAPLTAAPYPQEIGRITGITTQTDRDTKRNPCVKEKLDVKIEQRVYCTLQFGN